MRRMENLIFDNYSHDLRMNLNKDITLKLSRSLFWDVDPETIDPDKHVLFIIERVLTRGPWEEFQIIITHYGKESVGSSATQIRHLDKKTLSFCASYFNIPQEKFNVIYSNSCTRHIGIINWIADPIIIDKKVTWIKVKRNLTEEVNKL